MRCRYLQLEIGAMILSIQEAFLQNHLGYGRKRVNILVTFQWFGKFLNNSANFAWQLPLRPSPSDQPAIPAEHLAQRVRTRNQGWVANKMFEISKFKFQFPRARTYELIRARSRRYRSQIWQVNTRWKALAEIYTKHSFSPFSMLNFMFENLLNVFHNFAELLQILLNVSTFC